jgi:hypothetical protein
VWGSEDLLPIVGLNGRRSDARLAEINPVFAEIALQAGVDYRSHVVIGGDHGNSEPPIDLLLAEVERTRGAPPTEIEHTFRYIHQADTAWVEGHEWLGDAWLTPWPTSEVEAGEPSAAEEATILRELLGTIDAAVAANTISVDTTHLADLTVWLLDGLIDFSSPVSVIHNGRVVFSGEVRPDPGVVLTQTLRTGDVVRLRWAGIRIVDGAAHIVTTADVFPDIARGILPG